MSEHTKRGIAMSEHPLDSAISELRGEVSHTLLSRHPGWWGSSEWDEVMSITRSQIAAIRCLENIRTLDRLDGDDRIMVGRLREALRAERARASKAERELEARRNTDFARQNVELRAELRRYIARVMEYDRRMAAIRKEVR